MLREISIDEFYDALADFIETTGHSDSDIAEMFRVSIPTVVRWKNRKSAPHRFARVSICDKLEQDQEDTLFGPGSQHTEISNEDFKKLERVRDNPPISEKAKKFLKKAKVF